MRYRHTDLTQFAHALLGAAGAEYNKAQAVAEILVEGDLMGHTTHGLALLPSYLGELVSGSMRATGSPTVVSDHPAQPGRLPPTCHRAGFDDDFELLRNHHARPVAMGQ